MDALKRFFADKVVFRKIDLPVQTYLIGICLDIHVLTPGKNPRLEAADVRPSPPTIPGTPARIPGMPICRPGKSP